MKTKRRAFRAWVLLIIVSFGFVASICRSVSTHAIGSFTTDNLDNPSTLLTMQLYYEAAASCFGSSSLARISSVDMSFDNDKARADRNKAKSIMTFQDVPFLDNDKLYSTILEGTVSGNDDSKIYCSELKGVMSTLISSAGVTEKDAFCAVYNISAKYNSSTYGPRYGQGEADAEKRSKYGWPSDWPTGDDCYRSYDVAMGYLNSGMTIDTVKGDCNGACNSGFEFSIEARSKSEAKTRFENLFSSNLGNFGSSNSSVQLSKLYYLYYGTLDYGCGIAVNGSAAQWGTENPGGGSNVIAIPNVSGTLYYYNTSQFSNKTGDGYGVYANTNGGNSFSVNDRTQMSCLDVAQKLASSEFQSQDFTIAMNGRTIDSCTEQYKTNLGNIESAYAAEVELANNAKTLVGDIKALANSLAAGPGQRKFPQTSVDGTVYSTETSSLIRGYVDYMTGLYEKVAAGVEVTNKNGEKVEVANAEVFSYSIAAELINWVDNLTSDIEITGPISGETYASVALKDGSTDEDLNEIIENANIIIAQGEQEVARITEELDRVDTAIKDRKRKANQPREDLQGITWRYDEDLESVQCILPQDDPDLQLTAAPKVDLSAVTDYADISSNNASVIANNSEACYNSGIKSVGWLLCPALNNLEVTTTILDNIIQDWLGVGTEWYNSSSGTYTAWEFARSISNTLMIIVLVVIILSQLTGYGIDNYGIKKMLPRLIVMAILVNLSFIICELAVDVANILGVGLRDMFKALGPAVAEGGNGWGAGFESFISGAIASIFEMVGVAGVAAPAIITVIPALAGGGPMAVIIILLALVTILAALIVFFLMLGARTVIIIGCIALSPLAFASYVLPNTQALFKQWMNIFKAALVMFPLCGAVGGMGVLIRAIASTTEGVHMITVIIGFITPFLPFFLLPTLLRGALAALGKIGGAFTMATGAWRGGIKGAEGAVRSTDSYKTTMQEGHLRRMRNSLGIGEDGKLTPKGIRKEQRARAKGGAAMRRYAARAAMVQKDDADRQKAMGALLNLEAQAEIPSARLGYTDDAGNVTTLPDNDRKKFGGAFGDGTRGAYYGSQFLTAARKGDTVGMGAAIMAAQSSGMKEKDIASMVRQANNQGHINLGGNEKRAWAQDLAAQHGNGFLATDYELKEWAQRGGADTLGDYGHYFGTTNIKSDDIKENDVARLSGNSMAAMILSGKMSRTMAKNVLAQNPGLSEDKKIMLGALANGVTFNATTASDLAASAASAAAQYASASANTKINIGGGQMISQKTISKWLEPQFKVR